MTNPGEQNLHIHTLLIEACKKNDRKAQNQIYNLYYKNMYNTSLRIVRSEVVAEDLMQDAFISAFMHISSFTHEVSFGAWLKRIVINKSIDYLKKRKIDLVELKENFTYEAEEPPKDDEYSKFKAKQIIKAINQLPDGYRVIMNLYLLEGYDHEEIAQIMKISASTSRSQFTRGKRKLLEMLNDK